MNDIQQAVPYTDRRVTVGSTGEAATMAALKNVPTPVKEYDPSTVQGALESAVAQEGRIRHLLNLLEQKVAKVSREPGGPVACGSETAVDPNPGVSPLARGAWAHGHSLWEQANRLDQILENLRID